MSTATTGPGLVFLVDFFSSEIEQKIALVRRRQVASAHTPQQQTPSVLDAPRYPASHPPPLMLLIVPYLIRMCLFGERLLTSWLLKRTRS